MHSREGNLEAVAPFDLHLSAVFLERFRPMEGEQRIDDAMITKALMIGEQTVAFTVRNEGTTEIPRITYELYSNGKINNSLNQSAAERISFFLSLGEDIKPFYEISKNSDQKFYPIVQSLWGFHHVKFPSILEAAAWAILAQRELISVAKKMKKALVERFGSSLKIAGEKYWAFPDYSRLRDVGIDELYSVIRNRRKSEYLNGLFREYESIDEGFLRTAQFDEAKKALMQIKGIGEWSATFVLSRGLGRMEQLPENLKSIIPEAAKIYGTKPSTDRITSVYGKWAGYWLLYLWAFHMSLPSEARRIKHGGPGGN